MAPLPIVSVVTPVYNGAGFLEQCIESVLRQTCTDWEYVIYDNQSTDATSGIAERFAARDPRIRLLKAPDFSPIWTNHNRALRAVTPGTRYFKVLQADDVLYPECLERMIAVAEAHPSVGVVSSYRLVGRSLEHGGLMALGEEVMPGREAVRRILLNATPPWPDLGWVTGSPSSLLIRSSLLRDGAGFYDERFWHSDADAALRVLLESDLGFVHQVLTFTRLQERSLTPFSYRVNSFLAQSGLLLMRYGPSVLSPAEYRAKKMEWLRHYGWWIVKQTAKLSHYRHEGFRDFHSQNVAAALAEAGSDREVRLTLSFLAGVLRIPPRLPVRPGAAGPRSASARRAAAD